MPANKNAMTRYKILDGLLSSRYHNYSLDDLTEEVNRQLAEMYPDTNGVVRRTIEKDIYYLEYEDPFMVDIERYTVQGYNKEKQRHYTKQCLRYASPSFSIFKKEMTDDEEYLLGEALNLLGQFDGLPNFDALEGLRLGLANKERTNPIISFVKNPLENSNLLGEIFTAISRRLVIELKYHTFATPENVLKINLHPYLLKEYNRRWYVFGAAEEDGKLLSFSLERINGMKPLPAHKYLSYKGNINEIFEDIIGVTLYENSPIYQIYFWVSDFSKDYVSTKPLHESQRGFNDDKEEELRLQYPMLEGGRFFRIDCKYNYELIRELSSFGKELLILSPIEIQEKVRQRVTDMAKCYQNLTMALVKK